MLITIGAEPLNFQECQNQEVDLNSHSTGFHLCVSIIDSESERVRRKLLTL